MYKVSFTYIETIILLLIQLWCVYTRMKLVYREYNSIFSIGQKHIKLLSKYEDVLSYSDYSDLIFGFNSILWYSEIFLVLNFIKYLAIKKFIMLFIDLF